MYPLFGKWTILPGNEEKAIKALNDLAIQVKKEEPGTLVYLVHVPNFNEKSLPTPAAGEVIFFEVYKDKEASIAHISGPAFQNFIKTYGNLFLNDFSDPSQIYITLEVMTQIAGFIRETAIETSCG